MDADFNRLIVNSLFSLKVKNNGKFNRASQRGGHQPHNNLKNQNKELVNELCRNRLYNYICIY